MTETMVLVLHGNSEHVAYVEIRKQTFFKFVAALDLIKCLKEIK